jgi:hypothetical protein
MNESPSAVVNKVQVLLVGPAGSDREQLFDRIHETTEPLLGRIRTGAVGRVLYELADDPTPHLTDRYPRFAHDAEHVCAIVEVESATVSVPELVDELADLGTLLAPHLDPRECAVMAGTEHVIIAGTAPLTLVYPIRRVASMSRAAFVQRWFRGHVEVAADAGNLGKFRYRQFHADPEANERAAATIGVGRADFDGAAIGFYDTVDDFIRIAVDPDMRIEDELHFIDHSRSTLGLYAERA